MLSQTINDRYELLEQIGEGGFGSVYKARDLRLGHLVAVKILSVASEEHEELIRERFVSEAQISAQLQHENVLKTHNFGELEGDRLFLVSELLNGLPLSRRLRSGALPVQGCVELMRQFFAGLEEAHEFGVIHRDLKPSNLFLHQRQQRSHRQRKEILKIIDFGIAKSLDNSTKTMTGVVFGSPTYMSPEQIFTPKDITAKSDVYSAGIIFFQCLAGEVPFKQNPDLPMQIFMRHQSETPPSIQSLNPSFNDPYLEELISALLAKDPTQRPSAGQVLDVLEAYLSGERVELSSALSFLQPTKVLELPVSHDVSPTAHQTPPVYHPAQESAEPITEAPIGLDESLESLSGIQELSAPYEESTTVSPFPFKVSVVSSAEPTVSTQRVKKRAPKPMVMIGAAGGFLALGLAFMLSSSPSPSPDAEPPPIGPSSAQVTSSEAPAVIRAERREPAQEELIEFIDEEPSQQAKPDEEAQRAAQRKEAARQQELIRQKKAERAQRQRAAKEASKRAQEQAQKPKPKPKPKPISLLKKLKIRLPSQIRFKPGESVPFKVYVKNSSGQRVKSSEYNVTASISPNVGRIKGQTLKINATIDATVRAKLKVCARSVSGSRERVCATETLAIYKPMY